MVQQREVCLQLPVQHHTKCSYRKMDALPASGVWVSAHRYLVFLQNFVKSSLGRIFAKDLRFCEQLLRKIKVNTIAEEGRTWKKGSKSSPLLCNFLRQIQFLNFKIWTSQEACCLSYHFFKYKPNFTKFCTDTKPVSANSLSPSQMSPAFIQNHVSCSRRRLLL